MKDTERAGRSEVRLCFHLEMIFRGGGQWHTTLTRLGPIWGPRGHWMGTAVPPRGDEEISVSLEQCEKEKGADRKSSPTPWEWTLFHFEGPPPSTWRPSLLSA